MTHTVEIESNGSRMTIETGKVAKQADGAVVVRCGGSMVQVICLTISGDQENDPDILAMNGASAALCLSGIPFDGPGGAVRVGLVEGKLVANPTAAQKKVSSLELVIAATEDAVLMVEAGASEISEEIVLEAIAFGHAECKKLARAQSDLVQRAGKPRWTVDAAAHDAELKARVESLARPKLADALATLQKQGRAEAVNRVFEEIVQSLGVDETKKAAVREAFEAVEKAEVRRLIVERNLRVDGRKANEIRPISIDTAYL